MMCNIKRKRGAGNVCGVEKFLEQERRSRFIVKKPIQSIVTEKGIQRGTKV